MDFDEMAMEAAIWPWLDSDCMADPASEVDPCDYWEDEGEDEGEDEDEG